MNNMMTKDIIIEALKFRNTLDEKYYPKRGSLQQYEDNIENIKNNNDFIYHYMSDLNLLGKNGIRETERPVVPMKIGEILNEQQYYININNGDVYEYNSKKERLEPLFILYNLSKRLVVNLFCDYGYRI
jgi:hypothetical protein